MANSSTTRNKNTFKRCQLQCNSRPYLWRPRPSFPNQPLGVGNYGTPWAQHSCFSQSVILNRTFTFNVFMLFHILPFSQETLNFAKPWSRIFLIYSRQDKMYLLAQTPDLAILTNVLQFWVLNSYTIIKMYFWESRLFSSHQNHCYQQGRGSHYTFGSDER